MQLVKMLTNDDGDKIEHPVWCMVQHFGDARRTVCGGECFGEGESTATFKVKTFVKGGITCHICKEHIKWFKSIKL